MCTYFVAYGERIKIQHSTVKSIIEEMISLGSLFINICMIIIKRLKIQNTLDILDTKLRPYCNYTFWNICFKVLCLWPLKTKMYQSFAR